MAAKLWEAGSSNAFATTLNGSINSGDASITLTSASGLVAPGIVCIDRIDSNGTSTPANREYISFTGISTNTLTGCSRGLAGSSAQAHLSGAVVEENFSVSHWGEMVDFMQVSHDVSGNIVVSGTATIATLRVPTVLNASGASVIVADIRINRNIFASGASITGNFPIYPIWAFTSTGSAPSAYISNPLSMPQNGTWKWFSITSDGPASGGSYIFDVNNGGTSIFSAGTRLVLSGGGTFYSTASIATKLFNPGNKMWVDYDTAGINSLKITIQGGTQ
jgi:hypothetical protein